MQTPGKLFTLTKFVKNPSVNQANIIFQRFFFVLKNLSYRKIREFATLVS